MYKKIRYTIGEIIIITVGLLIALQINNWNESRKIRNNQRRIISNVIDDLNIDRIHIKKSLSEVKNQKQFIDELIKKVLNKKNIINKSKISLIRFSSDFMPITQRNHSPEVSNFENLPIRKKIQNYFLKEDEVLDIFLEYVDIIHNKVRPYLSSTGMHNLEWLDNSDNSLNKPLMLNINVLEQQILNERFQQILFERRLKTDALEKLLEEILIENQNLMTYLEKFR